jgi:tape measure domain-containing protein
MKFDNKQFESGVATSMNTLNGLKKGLDLSGSAKGLESINDAAKRVSFDGMANSIESVKVKFSALQVIAVTALSNIANSAVTAGKNLISSLTIDPIMEGFKEYETQMNAIQTILANTSTKGTTLVEVKAALQELNTYSDKTIYNFTEMSKNIGTFTAAGVDLKTSTAAIKGIANLAAVSGSNSQQASTAMYQLSQALAAGRVNLQDWNSVVNAGMGGAVFQNSLKETGKLMGKNIDESQSFRDSISDKDGTGWLTSDVLIATLQKFTGDMTASELAAKGYTQTQIESIIKMGQTANDAATKVKTFTQLLDTLKEAVGSGWAQTWQTLFGDFEEAKVMFTDVSNVLGGIIGASSKARNDMLTGWKDLGGRTALIDAIKNAFDGVMSVVTTLSGAFRDIFPATTSAQLFSFTEGLKSLTENFKFSETTLSNLRSTFKGVFAILDIGKTIFLAVANAIGIMLGGVGDLGSSILGLTGSLGEWFTALDNSIKKSDVFNKVLTALAYGIKNAFSSIAFVFDLVVKGMQKVIAVISEKISLPSFEDIQAFLELLGKRMTSISNEADGMKTVISGAFVGIAKSIADSKIGELFTAIWNTVKVVSDSIGTLVGKMADSITKAFSNANFSGMFDAIAGVSIGAVAISISKFLKSLTEPLHGLQGMIDGVTGILDGVRGSFEAYQQNLKAGILLKLAMAIGILAASIVAISLIDSGKLTSSLAAIGTLFAQLLIAMKLFTTIGEFKGGVIKASIVMITMSTAILILSTAMAKLATLDWNGIAKGTVGIAALSGTLVATSKLLSTGSGSMIKGSAGIVAFALAIKVLASACADLSKLSWNELAKGLTGVGVLLAEISVFLNTAKFSAKSTLTATGIVILAAAMKVLASACADFGNLSWSEISKGLISIGVLLGELSLFSNITGNAKNVISTGVALIAIAAAMKILASAMADFGRMSWSEIAKGLVAMGVALTEISIAVKLMPKNIAVTASGLVIMGGALILIADALKNMGSMSWEEIAKGLITMGGALTILSIALSSMTGSLAGSAALLVAAGALMILAPALSMLGAMTWESIIKGLVDLAATIAIFAIAAAVLTPILPSMLGLGAALVLLGVSMIGIGAGLALVGVGLSGVAAGFILLAGVTATGATAIVTALGIIIIGVAALIPQVMAKIGEGIIAFCKVLSDGIPTIVATITTIIAAIVDCIVTNIPVILNGVLTTLSSILDALITWIPTISQKVADIILALLKVIADNIPKFVKAGVDIIVGYIQGITDSLPKVIDAAAKLIVSFINGLADAVDANAGPMGDACLKLVKAIVDGIRSLEDKFIDAGIYAVQGYIKGLASMPGKIWDAGAALGNEALAAAKKALKEHSPSREFKQVGVYAGEGLVIGLNNMGTKVSNAGYDMGSNALDSMSNSIAGITDVINSDIDSQPVIRPVLDLTDIQNGSNKLYSMMNGIDNYGIDSSINSVSSTARSIQSKQVVNEPINNGGTNLATTNNPTTSKQPMAIQLVLQNGKAIAEYIIDDVDNLMGVKNNFTGRMVGS